VEAEPVYDRTVPRQPEDARLWIPGLRQRRHRADFDKAEAERKKRVGNLGVLVVAGRHAERVVEGDAGDGGLEPEVVTWRQRDRQAGFQCLDRQAVRRFGIEAEKRPPAQPFDEAEHHARSAGKIWTPSMPSGSGLTHSAA